MSESTGQRVAREFDQLTNISFDSRDVHLLAQMIDAAVGARDYYVERAFPVDPARNHALLQAAAWIYDNVGGIEKAVDDAEKLLGLIEARAKGRG